MPNLYARCLLFVPLLTATLPPFAEGAHKPAEPRDALTFENGDTLHGKLDREVGGIVYFKSDELGEVSVPWAKIRSLKTESGYVVLENKPGVRHAVVDAAQGRLSVENNEIRLDPGTVPPPVAGEGLAARPLRGERVVAAAQPMPVSRAQFILDRETFNRQVRERPNFFEGWSGSATAGVTLVQGTQNERTYTSAVALQRTVPTVSWLPTRDRTQADFSSSYGRVFQPAYTSGGVLFPENATKTSIFHADGERDEYFANRVYALAQTAFDHNYSQGLDLQQIYGAGLGVTAIRGPKQQLDLKATLQYEKQRFFSNANGSNQNLIGSTLSGTYQLKLPRGMVFDQQAAFLPAFNNARAYSANETDSFRFPVYKNLAFTLGTIDSYLNDPVLTAPPTTRNSFQFTTGVTYTVKSRY